MMEINPLKLDNADISRTIQLQHEDKIVELSLLGYSVHSATGGNFYNMCTMTLDAPNYVSKINP